MGDITYIKTDEGWLHLATVKDLCTESLFCIFLYTSFWLIFPITVSNGLAIRQYYCNRFPCSRNIITEICIYKDAEQAQKIVGYAFSNMINADLVVAALSMAFNRQEPNGDLIFHSDRGVQYASNKFRNTLSEFCITQSMSAKGDPYDNAVAENFFSCLKNELVHHKHYKTRAEAQADIFAYIETYYNSVRPHLGIGWVTPNKYEKHINSVYAAKVS